MSDRPEMLGYDRLAWVTLALEGTILELADASSLDVRSSPWKEETALDRGRLLDG